MDARRSLVAAAVMLAAAGCRGPTRGELGQALFSYDEGAFGCIAGCPSAAAPMATGSSVIIYVTNADDLADFAVSSTDESVATFFRSGTAEVNHHTWIGVHADAVAAGDARLSLADAQSGEEIDRLPLRVHDVAKIELSDRAEQYKDRLTIMEGGVVSLRMILRDGGNQALVGHGGIHYSYQGAADAPALLDVLFGEILGRLFTGTVPEYVEISTEGAGSGTITASSPAGASLEIPVQVVSASEVTSVKLEGEQSAPSAGDSYSVNAGAMAGAERVHSPSCTWSLSDVVGPVTIEHASRDYASLTSTEPGSATLTCNIGSAFSTLSVTFK